jgi:flagellar secretion chaperone FliS
MNTAPQAYLKTRAMTATPAELRLMLLDGAIRFANQAREGVTKKDYEQSYNGFTKCQNIILELLSALDKSKAPDLCDKLAGLYTFMFNRLVEASFQRSVAIVDEVLKLLEYERQTWALAMAKLGDEAAPATAQSTGAAKPALSITG